MKNTFSLYSLLFLCCVFFACKKVKSPSDEIIENPLTSITSPTAIVTSTTNSETTVATSTTSSTGGNAFTVDEPVVLAYFPSWSETFVNAGQNSKLREIPSFVNHVFFGFCKA